MTSNTDNPRVLAYRRWEAGDKEEVNFFESVTGTCVDGLPYTYTLCQICGARQEEDDFPRHMVRCPFSELTPLMRFAALQARVAELETALRPFADTWSDWLLSGDTYGFAHYVPPATVFKAAAAALGEGGRE